jgi:hypothetical protein
MLRETVNHALIHSHDQQKKGSSQRNNQEEEMISADSKLELEWGEAIFCSRTATIILKTN